MRDVLGSFSSPPQSRGPESGGQDFLARSSVKFVDISTDVGLAESREVSSEAIAVFRESRVASDLVKHVVLRLAVSREIEYVRLHVEVRHKLDDSRRLVSRDVVDHESLGVDDFHPRPLLLDASRRRPVYRLVG